MPNQCNICNAPHYEVEMMSALLCEVGMVAAVRRLLTVITDTQQKKSLYFVTKCRPRLIAVMKIGG